MSLTVVLFLSANVSGLLLNLQRFLRSIVSGDTWDVVKFTEFQPYHFRRIRLAVGVTDELFQR